MARRESVEVTQVLSPNSQLALRIRDADVVNLCTPKKSVPHAEDVIDLCTPQQRSELNVESNRETNSNVLTDATNRTTPHSEKYKKGLLELKNLQQKKEGASSDAVANDKTSSDDENNDQQTPEGKRRRRHLKGGAPRSSMDVFVRIRISNLPYSACANDLHGLFAKIHGCQNIVECYTALDRDNNVFFGSVSMPEPVALDALRGPSSYVMRGRNLRLRRQSSIFQCRFCTYSYADCNDHPSQHRNHCATSVHATVPSSAATSNNSRKIKLSGQHSPNDIPGHHSRLSNYDRTKPNDRWHGGHNKVGGLQNRMRKTGGGHGQRGDGRGYKF